MTKSGVLASTIEIKQGETEDDFQKRINSFNLDSCLDPDHVGHHKKDNFYKIAFNDRTTYMCPAKTVKDRASGNVLW